MDPDDNITPITLDSDNYNEKNRMIKSMKVIIDNKENNDSIKLSQLSTLINTYYRDSRLNKGNMLKNNDFLRNFTKTNIIGEGSFGLVISGQNICDNQYYAIKCIRIPIDSVIEKHKIVEYTSEMKILSNLKHPNIIRYHTSFIDIKTNLDYNEKGDKLITYQQKENTITNLQYDVYMYLQMELMELSLKAYLKKDDYSKKGLIQQIIRGVSYLHSKNIVHCDLKPDNILINYRDGLEVKIADFGLASIIGISNKNYQYYGCPLYKAPEMDLENYSPHYSSDVYSLGIIFYEIMENFSTDMQRITEISNFKKSIIKTDSILDNMILYDYTKRPDLKKLIIYIKENIT